MNDRQGKWLDWIGGVRSRLVAMPFGDAPRETLDFFANGYAMHTPALLRAPDSPAMAWTVSGLRGKVPDLPIEVQSGRLGSPDHESNPNPLRTRMGFHAFLDHIESGPGNDTYLTARNTQSNAGLMHHLGPDLNPLPGILRPRPGAGFLWMGRDTRTELHIDHTCNLLVQLVGRRIVRYLSPWHHPSLPDTRFVYTSLRWLEPEAADRHGLRYAEVALNPGDALFLPVGWYHCVESPGISIMASFTNFWWPNQWGDGYPS